MTRKKNILDGNEPQKLHMECPNFSEAIELFIKDQKLKNRTPRTLQWHRENFRALKKALQEQNIPWELKSLTKNHLKHNFILYSMENNNNKATTINNRMKTFQSFWKFLCTEGYLATNITVGIEKLREQKMVIVTLDESEIKAMFKACNLKTFTGVRDLTMMKTLIDTGMRLQELTRVVMEDILFRENLIKVNGKGQKQRWIPLSPELKRVIKEYLAVRGESLTEALFITLDQRPIDRRTVQDRLALLAKKAGVTKQSSPHIWRHTFAKYYILNGGDPFSLKKILGHSNWAMVHRYVDMFGGEIKAQHEKASPLKNL
ncbi:MAG: tyrosine-type recombinase/integrase [Syntrophomonadaceae bacterium]|nr:tyrosine-type recombinase/integrase [Syntrophomonadaceae bacterium]